MEKIKFIDLFAGIGGFRLAFERLGCKCVYSSEIDPHACKMYELNFGVDPYSDITKVNANDIPDFDILCAGFPCQSFSICGKQKGFADETRGTLFFDICRILKAKKPQTFILENVFFLEKHDKGRTLNVILSSLNDLGYNVSYRILNAKDFGVPQNRDRIIIVGCLQDISFDFDRIEKNEVTSMEPYLDKQGDFIVLSPEQYTLLPPDLVKKQPKSGLMFCGYLNKNIRKVGVRDGTEYLSRVHRQPDRIYDVKGIHPTLASQESCGRYYIKYGNIVRKLTLDECYRFMGFPDNFKKIGSKAQLYNRIGNSVCVNMIESVGREMINQFFNGR